MTKLSQLLQREAARTADATDSRRFHSITAIKREKSLWRMILPDAQRRQEPFQCDLVRAQQQHKGNRKASFFLKPASSSLPFSLPSLLLFLLHWNNLNRELLKGFELETNVEERVEPDLISVVKELQNGEDAGADEQPHLAANVP